MLKSFTQSAIFNSDSLDNQQALGFNRLDNSLNVALNEYLYNQVKFSPSLSSLSLSIFPCLLQETSRAEGLGPGDQPSFPPLQRHPQNRLH